MNIHEYSPFHLWLQKVHESVHPVGLPQLLLLASQPNFRWFMSCKTCHWTSHWTLHPYLSTLTRAEQIRSPDQSPAQSPDDGEETKWCSHHLWPTPKEKLALFFLWFKIKKSFELLYFPANLSLAVLWVAEDGSLPMSLVQTAHPGITSHW